MGKGMARDAAKAARYLAKAQRAAADAVRAASEAAAERRFHDAMTRKMAELRRSQREARAKLVRQATARATEAERAAAMVACRRAEEAEGLVPIAPQAKLSTRAVEPASCPHPHEAGNCVRQHADARHGPGAVAAGLDYRGTARGGAESRRRRGRAGAGAAAAGRRDAARRSAAPAAGGAARTRRRVQVGDSEPGGICCSWIRDASDC